MAAYTATLAAPEHRYGSLEGGGQGGGHTDKVWDVATPATSSSWFISAGWDGTLKRWEHATGRCERTFADGGHKGHAYCVDVAPDDGSVISGGEHGDIIRWHAKTGKWTHRLPTAHDGPSHEKLATWRSVCMRELT